MTARLSRSATFLRMRRVALGILSYVEFGLLVLIFGPIMALVSLFAPRDLRRRGQWMRRFGKASARLSPLWHFSVDGEAPADIGTRAYVVVANHESSADPFLLSGLPWDMRWVAKESLFKLPVIGWLMRWGGDIKLRRGDGESVRAMLAEARRTLDSGLSVMIFPEGTRSGDGSLGPFKDGAFQMAIAAGAPILPLAIEGTRACRPKGSLWFGDAAASVRVLAPIATAGASAQDLPAIRDAARGQIAAALDEMRRARSAATAPVAALPQPVPMQVQMQAAATAMQAQVQAAATAMQAQAMAMQAQAKAAATALGAEIDEALGIAPVGSTAKS
jgi:1-acyl-sn-glycerol-3-phosphate acyltransferase